jgi:glutamate synthase domain-containing protein 1
VLEELARAVGLSVLLWRAVPVDSSCLGSMAAILFYFTLLNIFRAGFEELARAVGLSVLLWREVPVDSSCLGSMARATQPAIRQVFVVAAQEEGSALSKEEISLKMFILRKVCFTLK